MAQTFTTLHSFTAPSGPDSTNSDGANPIAGLITNSSGNTLYGTAKLGGSSGVGTVFAVNTDGTGFTNLHTFVGGSDGGYPAAGLILSGNTLYGTEPGGGSTSNGAVFKVNTDGTGFTNLYSFGGGGDGAIPLAGLILSGNTLYGTAAAGGVSDNGTVFKVNTSGTGFTTLHSFMADSGPNRTNSDGAQPTAGLILSGNTLYGTAEYGGRSGFGTVFAVKTDGTGFTNLHSFTAESGPNRTNSDGAYPQSGLILSGNTLYGTAPNGGSLGNGTVFKVNTNGTGFSSLYSFTATSGFPSTNSDGANPISGLILSGNILYGTAPNGGSSGNGTVFAVNTDGTGFTGLHTFTAPSSPFSVNPSGQLILSGNTLYGTASGGGSSGNGMVFSLSLGPGTSSTTAVASSLNPSAYGEAGVTFTATVTGSIGTPTGIVQFLTNGVNFGGAATLVNGNASSGALPATLAPGTYTVTTAYSGDANFSMSSGLLSGGQTVTKANSLTAVASSSDPSVIGQAGVTFTATVTDSSSGSSGRPTGTVQFTTNGVNFGGAATLSSGSATSGALSVALPTGTYTVTAAYSGDANFSMSSGSLSGGQSVSTNNSCTCAGSSGVMAVENFMILHSFTATNVSGFNGDGAHPSAGLLLSGNTLYGTATYGSSADSGSVFALNTNGTGFTTLHSFTATSGPNSTNSDGADPTAGLILSGNTLYGTAVYGGSAGSGTVFSLNTNGTDFTTLHNFAGYPSDGALPRAGLLLSGNTLYGTAIYGGSAEKGTVFALSTNGTGFTTLHSFTGGSDGATPGAVLVLSGNTLYGTAAHGGSAGKGTVFALSTNGTGFTILHSFTGGSDGATPDAGLLLSGSTLYGTALFGGIFDYGTVFALATDGTGFTTLHSFNFGGDGIELEAGLILSGNNLYGTASFGGSSSYGTVFALSTNGAGFTTLHSFTDGSDGADLNAGLIISGNTLYGTAVGGGISSNGTVFALTLTNTPTNSNCLQVQCPSNIVVTACINIQEFYAPTVADLACSNWTVVLTPPSGSSFAPGTVTTVECAVTDCCGYSNRCSFTVTVVCPGSAFGQNIIQNGDFCLGNTNFSSDYQYVAYDYANYKQTPQVVAGDYTVGPFVPPSYFDWAPFYTVGGGCAQMLIVNGAAQASEAAWDQIVTVLPNTTYTISFYLAEISNPAIVAEIGVVLGGNQIGTAIAPSVIDAWQQYSFTWNSGTSTNVLLALKDLQTSDTYNDFAIGNISMSKTPPHLAIILSGASVILTWPANAAGFTLQSTTSLASPAVWSTVSPAPVIVNGQFAVTKSISVTATFYRLSL